MHFNCFFPFEGGEQHNDEPCFTWTVNGTKYDSFQLPVTNCRVCQEYLVEINFFDMWHHSSSALEVSNLFQAKLSLPGMVGHMKRYEMLDQSQRGSQSLMLVHSSNASCHKTVLMVSSSRGKHDCLFVWPLWRWWFKGQWREPIWYPTILVWLNSQLFQQLPSRL